MTHLIFSQETEQPIKWFEKMGHREAGGAGKSGVGKLREDTEGGHAG